jgi:GDP/UDP-N,N'-diacetylbacillosamine 2-epimerase (hydrolysing)
MKRKVCVITGGRADYGLLRLVMKKIHENPSFTLQIIATGSHLSSMYGQTYKEIEADNLVIDRKVECLSFSDSPVAIADAMSKVLVGCAKALDELQPDIVLILGDRFEIFAAVSAALLARIPVAHVHGGEVTEGAYDEAFRHSITKMSSVHFVATEEYRKRVIQLGENPTSVHLVGGLGVDAIASSELFTREHIEKALGVRFRTKNLLITFHPATLEEQSPDSQVREVLAALSNRPDTSLIFTLPNADTGSFAIVNQLKQFIERNENAYLFDSLGQRMYLSCMSIVDGVVGNSSSGILEAPSFGIGTVNIGNRQHGRTKSESVIDSYPDEISVRRAIDTLYSTEFQSRLFSFKNPYGEGGASDRILDFLREIDLSGITKKTFYDVHC